MWLPATLRRPSTLTIIFKSQALCAFQFKCKQTVVKYAIFPELWVLQRCKTEKVTSSLTQGHWQSCNSIGHAWFPIIKYFSKFKEVTWPWTRPLRDYLSIWRLIFHTVNQRMKFQASSLSHSKDILGEGGLKIQNGSCVVTTPFQGQFVMHKLGNAMINLHTKFEVFMFTQYEDMKGNAKYRNWVVWDLGVIQGHRQCHHSIKCIYYYRFPQPRVDL